MSIIVVRKSVRVMDTKLEYVCKEIRVLLVVEKLFDKPKRLRHLVQLPPQLQRLQLQLQLRQSNRLLPQRLCDLRRRVQLVLLLLILKLKLVQLLLIQRLKQIQKLLPAARVLANKIT
jgi:hypothetical protein